MTRVRYHKSSDPPLWESPVTNSNGKRLVSAPVLPYCKQLYRSPCPTSHLNDFGNDNVLYHSRSRNGDRRSITSVAVNPMIVDNVTP
jgi:hypothetical protein